jgi:hypothetical protein
MLSQNFSGQTEDDNENPFIRVAGSRVDFWCHVYVEIVL